MSSRYDLAIITGGSSGIGSSIIEGLVNVGRTASIFNISRRIPSSFSIGPNRVHLECDLSDRDARKRTLQELIHRIETTDSNGPILLVNNAGLGIYGEIWSKSPQEHLELLEVNVNALVDITVSLLPVLQKRGGAILNISSTSAFQPTPGLSTYGASKAFVLNWTLALNDELGGSKVRAIAICPGPTKTQFFRRAGFSESIIPDSYGQSSEEVAKLALKALDQGKSFTVTGFKNKAASLFSRLLPLSLRTKVAGKVIRHFRPKPN
ncbi:SDR family NAD(P)-dependent oxidoreductase [Pelagicoccus albus]|uniref:SDR family NAD(P)-dependent oxidoreductase n=1 Tax=Pelagicoccus albus TaxID=415222 RepID=A0A7X1E9S8_9BACT|nr:SDR family NAD(P)-dependent oxidoreductase [Pelagicoccus albus]MBC2607671.1 SDR family NAD(P)-dependent oxidoreductase [Pelagicoccus albus]